MTRHCTGAAGQREWDILGVKNQEMGSAGATSPMPNVHGRGNTVLDASRLRRRPGGRETTRDAEGQRGPSIYSKGNAILNASRVKRKPGGWETTAEPPGNAGRKKRMGREGHAKSICTR